MGLTWIGPVIDSEKELIRLKKKGEPLRSLLIQALMGEVPAAALYRVWPGGPVRTAERVFRQFLRCMDPSLVWCWDGNAAQKRRKADSSWSQPLGSARRLLNSI